MTVTLSLDKRQRQVVAEQGASAVHSDNLRFSPGGLADLLHGEQHSKPGEAQS